MLNVCSLLSPILSFVDQIISAVFSAFSFLGVSAPSISNLILPLFGCTTA